MPRMPARRGPQTAVQAQAIAIRDLEVLRRYAAGETLLAHRLHPEMTYRR